MSAAPAWDVAASLPAAAWNTAKAALRVGTRGLRPLAPATCAAAAPLLPDGGGPPPLVAALVTFVDRPPLAAVRVRGVLLDGSTGRCVAGGRVVDVSSLVTVRGAVLLVFDAAWAHLHAPGGTGDPVLVLEAVDAATAAPLVWSFVRLRPGAVGEPPSAALPTPPQRVRVGWPPHGTADDVAAVVEQGSALPLRAFLHAPTTVTWDERRVHAASLAAAVLGGVLVDARARPVRGASDAHRSRAPGASDARDCDLRGVASPPLAVLLRRRRRVPAPPDAGRLVVTLLGADTPGVRLRYVNPRTGDVTYALPAGGGAGASAARDVAPPLPSHAAAFVPRLPADVDIDSPPVLADSHACAVTPSAATPRHARGGAAAAPTAAGTATAAALARSNLWRPPLEACAPPSHVIAACRTSAGGASALAFSPDGGRLAVACGAAATGDGVVRVFDVAGADGRGFGAEVAALVGYVSAVTAVAWSADSRRLAAAAADGSAVVWDVAPPPPALLGRPLPPQDVPPAALCVHAVGGLPAVTAVAFAPGHPAGDVLVTGAADGGLRVWRVVLRAQLSGDALPSPLAGLPAAAELLGFIGSRPAGAGGTGDDGGYGGGARSSATPRWPTARDGPPPRALTTRADPLATGRRRGSVVTFAPTAAGSDAPAAGHAAAVTALDAFGGGDGDPLAHARPAGAPATPVVARRLLLSADAAGCLIVWRGADDGGDGVASAAAAAAWVPLQVLRPSLLRGVSVAAVAARPGAEPQFAVLAPGHYLRLFDVATCAAVRAFGGASCAGGECDAAGGSVAGAAWSPDGRWLATGGDDGALRVWDGDTGAGGVVTGRSVSGGGGRAPIAFPAPLRAIAWHPRLHLVAVAASGGPHAVMLCAPDMG